MVNYLNIVVAFYIVGIIFYLKKSEKQNSLFVFALSLLWLVAYFKDHKLLVSAGVEQIFVLLISLVFILLFGSKIGDQKN